MIKTEDVCAIIVTYNPDVTEFIDNIQSVKEQVGQICVVDNSTNVRAQNDLKNFSDEQKYTVITNHKNVGIAKAQNIGTEWAMQNGFEAFFYLDQDSKIADQTVNRLVEHQKSLALKGKKVACIGPLAYNRDKSEDSVYHTYEGNDSQLIEVSETLSSGMLITKNVIKEIGLMEEELFIDLVDYEWCWRAKDKGFTTYIASDVKLAHRLGDDRFSILGVNVGLPSPIRHYYQFRNTIIILRRSYVPKGFKNKYLLYLPLKFVFYALFTKNKGLRTKMMVKGIRDGFRGVMGKGI
ncbi:glycosyltransferase family 2 protein [Robertmurraya korlensis]|uniref:glycosyltransferase family 2 protein n=1 Tax=Robertmurraya korlensis TaxID=519977 RepID=UPI0008247251|nr:glycosyltransferase family 2 protein [Robertmurraya korlensis]